MIRCFPLLLLFVLLSCRSDKRYHDQPEVLLPEQGLSYFEKMDSLRTEKNKSFKNGKASPLTSSVKKGFTGLDYFAIDSTFIVQARLEPEVTPLVTVLPTTTSAEQAHLLYGILYFSLRGKEFKLHVYRDPVLANDPEYKDYLFLPFTDLTNSNTTYGGGRYMDLSLDMGNRITLDFNKAYNPYCAYNKKYSCPLVPAENHLEIAVEAGEKAFKKGE